MPTDQVSKQAARRAFSQTFSVTYRDAVCRGSPMPPPARCGVTGRIQDPRQPGRHDDRRLLVLTRNRMSRAKTCLLIYQAPEPYIHEAGAERASSACKHSSCNSCRMLRTKLLGFLHDGACSRIEPRTESPIISRSVIGTFGEPGGNRNWRYNNHAYIRPELTRILHPFFLSHEIPGGGPRRPPTIASRPLRGQRRYPSPRRPYGPGG